MSCPVTSGAFKALNEYFFEQAPGGKNRRVLYEELRDRWLELEERISQDEPKISTKRLRAFYAIEIFYYVLIPGLTLPANLVDVRSSFLLAKFERSRAGLTNLIELCEDTSRRIVVEQGELQLGVEPKSALIARARHGVAALDPVGSVVMLCAEAAKTLRPRMRGKTTGIMRVGKLLGDGLIIASTSLEQCMHYLRTMLEISIHNPVSPMRHGVVPL
jgi:hypothetical protein